MGEPVAVMFAFEVRIQCWDCGGAGQTAAGYPCVCPHEGMVVMVAGRAMEIGCGWRKLLVDAQELRWLLGGGRVERNEHGQVRVCPAGKPPDFADTLGGFQVSDFTPDTIAEMKARDEVLGPQWRAPGCPPPRRGT
jgi:hypothetical protein